MSPGTITTCNSIASTLGAFIGSLAVGFIADTISFSAINWMNTILAGLAIAIIVALLKPRDAPFSAVITSSFA